MINTSRLTQAVSSKVENDPFKSNFAGEGVQGGNGLPSDSLLTGANPITNGSALGKSNTFDQLLQLATLDSDKTQKNLQKRDSSAENERSKQDDRKMQEKKTATDKKSSKETDSARSKDKSKSEKKESNDSSELAQLLAYQQQGTLQSDVNSPNGKTVNAASQKTDNATQLSGLNTGAKTLKASHLEQQQNLDDSLKNLDQKFERLTAGHQAQTASTSKLNELNELNELASKFDSVQMDFSSATQNAQAQAKLTQAQLEKAQLTKENLLKMMQQDMVEGDAAFRDFLKLSAAQSALTETQASEKLALLNQLKEANLDQLTLNQIRQDALLAQQQLREVQNGQPAQWKAIDELSPDQIAMLDTLSGVKGTTNSEVIKGFAQHMPESVQARIMGQNGEQSKDMSAVQNSLDTQTMFAALKNDGGASNGFSGNNSSFSGNSSRGEMSPIGQATTGLADDIDSAGQEKAQQAKADARTRESERTREMARTAAQRAQTIAAELAAKGGGTAKVQIKDSQLGVVELRINMSDNNRMNVKLVANSDRIKQELEKHAEALKDGLEKHQLIVEGVNFTTDMKLGESSFQNSTQSDSQNQQQAQAQNQQGFGSFQQNGSGQGQGSFEQERFFESQQFAGFANQTPQKQSRQNYAGKNETQTNIQRSANGSLKVSA